MNSNDAGSVVPQIPSEPMPSPEPTAFPLVDQEVKSSVQPPDPLSAIVSELEDEKTEENNG